jgi:hypothetical protein
MNVGVIMDGEAKLLEVVGALSAPRRFTGVLDRWQQKGNQDADDRNHDEKFNQRKTETALRVGNHGKNPKNRFILSQRRGLANKERDL